MAAENDTKMDGKSLDITKENIAALKELFPEIVEEGKIDFEKLKVILGEEVDDDNERYNFTWHGKNQVIRMSQTPSMGTLRPCKEESVDWDTTQNLYIEGDNLEVLKLLQKSYFGKIKLIFIDPPYNTGNDFIYWDDYKSPIDNYLNITGQIDNDGRSVSTNNETNGRFHTDWLSMMYPRLKLSRNLLSQDGAIYISIDDVEYANLKKLMDEIFGEINYISTIVWQKRTSPDARRNLNSAHDYILVYAKSADNCKDAMNKLPFSDKRIKEYKNLDNDSRGPWASVDITGQTGHATDSQYYTIMTPSGIKYEPPAGRCWALSEKTFNELVADNRIWFGNDGSSRPRQKRFLKEMDGLNTWTWWSNDDVGHNQEAAKELKEILGASDIFNNPKPTRLIKKIVELSSNDGDIVLDFFSGSATTADALMQANNLQGTNRHFILVQLPELCGSDTPAGKIGFPTICEIGKERIRRAGNIIRKQNVQTPIDEVIRKIDAGFKVFKLDSSNVKKWNPVDDVKQTLLDYENNIISNYERTDLDVVYEIMLKMGLELTSKIDVISSDNTTLYSVSSGALMICLGDIKDTSVAEKMIFVYKEQKPFVWKVVFKDNGFASDDVKANTRETLKMAGLPEGSFVTL